MDRTPKIHEEKNSESSWGSKKTPRNSEGRINAELLGVTPRLEGLTGKQMVGVGGSFGFSDEGKKERCTLILREPPFPDDRQKTLSSGS